VLIIEVKQHLFFYYLCGNNYPLGQVLLQNLIGRTSLVGWVVKSHPTNRRAYILADSPDADAIGTVAQSVPSGYWGLVNLINTVNFNDVIVTPRTGLTASTTEQTSDSYVEFNSSTTVYYYLLDSTGSGRIRNIANIGAGKVIVIPAGDPSDPSNIDLIDNETTQTIDQWENMEIIDSKLNNWKII
jgi:hypothetical protein